VPSALGPALQIRSKQFEIDHRAQPLQAVAFGRELLQPLVNVEKPRLTAHLRPPAQTPLIESPTRQNYEVFGGLQLSTALFCLTPPRPIMSPGAAIFRKPLCDICMDIAMAPGSPACGSAPGSRSLANIAESHFDTAIQSLSEQILLSRQHRQQQPHPLGDEREPIIRARQAAEALFTVKRPVGALSVPDTSPAEQSTRKPRLLSIVPAAPVRVEEVKGPVRLEQQTPRAIPRSQFARIRTWVKYGMTVAQVANVYGVARGDVERILRNV
jgi:hypothetical protein